MSPRLGSAALVLALAGIAIALGSAPTRAQATDDDYEDLLGGFEETDDEADGELDDLLGGFDDEGDDDDFGDETGGGRVSWVDDHLDLTGSVSLGASYNVLAHCASAGPSRGPIASCGEPPIPGQTHTGTYYGNLQRLRLRGDIQLDVYLPGNWKARAQAFGWYDFAYSIHGRETYTPYVLQDYELRGEILDLYVGGRVTSWLDLKLGRQVVNWGRSDALRVNDVLNALNNLEPGLADIEDLRLPSTMAKIDAYFWKLSFSAIVIPEIRFDWNPPPGSDFFPAVSFDGLPPVPPGAAFSRDQIIAGLETLLGGAGLVTLPFETEVDQWGADPEYAGSITGIFSGWDLSFYIARVYQNRTTPVINLPTFDSTPLLTREDRVTMVGLGGNYTTGSWLLKAEVAWFDELDFFFLKPNPALTDPFDPFDYWVGAEARLSRLDWMVGVEYYGWNDLTIAFELAHRHFFDYDPLLAYLPNYLYEDNVEVALRLRYEMMNARLKLNALGLVLANSGGFLGSTLRLDAEYELMDALSVGGGLLWFFGDEQIPFDTWDRNGRLFAKIKYSF